MRFFAWGVIGAAIYGVVKGMRNGNVKQLVKDFPSNLNPSNLQQMIQPLQQMTQPLAGMTPAGMTPAGMTQPLAAMAQSGMNNSSTKNQTKKQGV